MRSATAGYRRVSRPLIAGMLLIAALITSVARAAAPAGTRSRDQAPHYAGWAMDAYPGDSVATLAAEMRRQIDAGANVVWLGHNNPGEVGKKNEPALSYAVWAAAGDAASPDHAIAIAMVQAQRNALEAARSLGVKVILPVGYQIQMGAAWNAAHRDDLRRNPDGTLYWHGGRSASFYAPDYRRDILAYYRWVDATFVHPYADTILMLNIADEPADGDWSSWADAAFRAQHGYGLAQAGNDAARQRALGRFQADYIADYAAWSARQWLAIDPAVRVTLSFCGGYGRYQHEGPDLEAIFREAPSNFVVTFDAYPRDGLYNTALRAADLTALFSLIRTLGYYATRYDRPLWLWSTGNSWGLNGASSDPGTIADAVANGIYLAQLVNQVGGALQGIAVWNYNIRTQGLYADTHHLTYVPDQMFARVSASFPLLRQIMAATPGTPDTVVLAPNEPAIRQAGAQRLPRADDLFAWSALAMLARNNVGAVTLTHLDGETPTSLHTAIVLARAAADLSPIDRQTLQALLTGGGTVVAAPPVASALAGGTVRGSTLAGGGTPAIIVRRLRTPRGTLLSVEGAPVERLFVDRNAAWATPVWTLLLGHAPQRSGYTIGGGGATLLYSGPSAGAAQMSISAPAGSAADLTVYDAYGAALQTIHLPDGGTVQVSVPRRAYALVPAA